MADFYLDNDVALAVAELLRTAGHTAVTVRELARERDTDDEHLLVAAQQDRIFATHNERDLVLLHDAWQRWSAAWGATARHAGILIVPQGRRYGIDWGAEQITEAIVMCLEQCPPVGGELFRRREVGWERRRDRSWVSCT